MLRCFKKKAKGIIVTAVGMEHNKEESARFGAWGFIRKPLKQAEIVSELEIVMKIK